MKKRQLFTLALLGATVMFTSSCSDDEEDAPLGPTLTMMETNSGSTGGNSGKTGDSRTVLPFVAVVVTLLAAGACVVLTAKKSCKE